MRIFPLRTSVLCAVQTCSGHPNRRRYSMCPIRHILLEVDDLPRGFSFYRMGFKGVQSQTIPRLFPANSVCVSKCVHQAQNALHSSTFADGVNDASSWRPVRHRLRRRRIGRRCFGLDGEIFFVNSSTARTDFCDKCTFTRTDSTPFTTSSVGQP